jgi:glutamyl-tRNA synthetase
VKVRVRYAPSPTGFQHIGSARTALFNYLYARSMRGCFVLRIEDTDRERYRDDALEDIYDTFGWLGLRWDEGPDAGGRHEPYFQSERTELYRRYADALAAGGHGYYCYCSPERLQQLKEQQRRRGEPTGYDRRCRELSRPEREALAGQGITPVVRFKVPLEGKTTFQDQLLGTIETANREINPDPVLLKSDGFPTYHLANVVDDHLMEITHILRAQEWLPSTPLHVLLYEALGWEPPCYCHLPMVLGPDGQKLSKRHGATRVAEFREKGYVPEAVLNYIALLGWSFDDSREFFTLQELEHLFSLDRLNKAPAVFDYKKLDWFNGQYIRRLEAKRLRELLLPYLQQAGLVSTPPAPDELRIVDGLPALVQERLTVLADVVELTGFLFRDAVAAAPEELVPKRLDRGQTAEALRRTEDLMSGFDARPDEENERRFRALAGELGIKLGDLLMSLRVALTGSRVSPPLFESMRLLGEDKVRKRIRTALGALSG